MKWFRSPTLLSWCVFVLASWGFARCPAAQDPKLAAAIPAIQESIRKSGADVGVAFRTLDGGAEWLFRADKPFHAASTMKVPVLIELFHQRQQGKLTLDDPLRVKNEFRSLVDGSIYTLDPSDDSETDLYKAVGQTRTLAQLCELMITVSSNLATNLLLEKLGVDDIRGTVHSLRADGMNVLRGARPEDYLERSRTSFANVKFVTRGGRSPGKITRISHSIRELHRIRVTLSESQGGGSHYAQSVHILEVNGVKYILRHNAKRWAYMTSYDRTHLHHLRGYGLSR